MKKARAKLSSRSLSRSLANVPMVDALRRMSIVGSARVADGAASAPSVTYITPQEKDAAIDFGKFLLAREGGGMIPWSKFILMAEDSPEAKASISTMKPEDLARCRQAYDGARSTKDPKEGAGSRARIDAPPGQ